MQNKLLPLYKAEEVIVNHPNSKAITKPCIFGLLRGQDTESLGNNLYKTLGIATRLETVSRAAVKKAFDVQERHHTVHMENEANTQG